MAGTEETITASIATLGVEKYLARQPIFDRKESVIGYELLFRSSLDNYFKPQDSGLTSEFIVNNYLLFGLQTLTGGRRAFINFNRKALVHDHAALLPKESIVVEILEDTPADEDVILACRRLKDAGYTIALDDFVYCEKTEPLLEFADIVKVDFLATSPEVRLELVERLAPTGCRMLAEKVETQEDAQSALEMGYTYFQGYFFCIPQIMQTREIQGFKPNYLRILQAVHRPEMNLWEIEEIIRQEPSLLYKLLRYLNSDYFGLRQEIISIRHAIALLGEQYLRKWTSIVALVEMAAEKPVELLITCLVRARFCELLAVPAGMPSRNMDLFLLGLFSSLDAILGRPMSDILMEVPVADDLKDALLGKENRLRHILDAILCYERGEWAAFQNCAAKSGLNTLEVPDAYLDSVAWAKQIFK